MQKKFIVNLFLLLLLNFLVKPVWIFGIDRSVQNILGASQYGIYYTLLNFSFLFSVLLDFGITNFSSATVSASQRLVVKYFPDLLAVKWLLVIIYIFITLISAFFSAFDFSIFPLLLMLMINQVLTSFLLFIRANISALHHFKADALLSIMDKTLMIIGGLAIILWEKVSVMSFVLIQTIALFLAVLTAYLILKTKTESFWQWNLSLAKVLSIIKRTFPYALLIFLMTAYSKIDTVMLERMLPDGSLFAGIYAQGYRIVEALSMTGYLFSVLLLPIFSYLIKQKKSVLPVLQSALGILYPVSVSAVIYIWMMRSEITDWLYADIYTQSAIGLGLINIIFLPIAMGYIFGTLLTANGSLKILNIISFLGLIINIILNLFLIPEIQVKGAAVASVLTQSVVVGLQIFYSWKVFRFSFNKNMLLSFISFPVISCLLLLGLNWYDPKMPLMLHFVIYFLILTVFSLSTGVIPLKDFIELMKWRR